jgi:putative membrane protein
MTHTGSAAPALSDATAMAVERTRLAHERTLMAWIRTSVSLISFGFTIYKFFQYLHHDAARGIPPEAALNPRRFGMAMICIGLFMLVVATIQHRRNLKHLDIRYGGAPRSLATVVAALVGGIGIVALLIVFLRQ